MAESEDVRRAAAGVVTSLRKLRRGPQNQIPWLTADPLFEEGITVWMHTDGGLRWYDTLGNVYEATKTSGGTTTSSTGFPADPQPELFQKTYVAQWARTFCDQHGVETGDLLDFGDSPDGAHTGRRVMIGLDSATIQTDLAASDIDAVEIQLALSTAYQPPVTVHFGLHDQTSAPATYSAVQRDNNGDMSLDFPADGWQPLHDAFGRWLRDNYGDGLTIDQPPGMINSGQFAWAATQIRISYTK